MATKYRTMLVTISSKKENRISGASDDKIKTSFHHLVPNVRVMKLFGVRVCFAATATSGHTFFSSSPALCLLGHVNNTGAVFFAAAVK